MRMRPRRSPVPIELGGTGLAAFISRHAPDWSMPLRAEPWHKLLLILSGAGRIERPGSGQAFPEETILLIPAGTVHRVADAPGGGVIVAGICLDPQRLAGSCGASWPPLARRLEAGIAIDRQTREALLRLVGEVLGARSNDLATWGRMLLLLSQVAARPAGARPDARHGAGLASALAWLDEHCVQPVCVAELAARAGLGYRTFTAQVRRRTGESVLARILRLRLERAEVLLRRGMPVMEAAMASGFGDLSGFYRHFRRRYGMAPGTFRTRSEVR